MKIKNIFSKCVLFILLLFMVYIFYYSLTQISDRVAFFKEYVENETLLVGVAAIIIVSLFLFMYHKIEKMNSIKIKIAIGVAVILMFVGQVFIITNFPVTPTTDSYMVCDQALALAKGKIDQIDVESFYFSVYSNNNFTVILLSYLYRILLAFNITNINMANLFFNAVCIDVGILFSFLTIKKIFGIHKACSLLYVFTFSPVFYVALIWSYTNIYSIPIQMAIIYLGVLISKEKRKRIVILETILLAFVSIVGYYIRPTTTIVLIAVVICAVLHKISVSKKVKQKDVIIASVFLVVAALSYMGCNSLTNKYVDQERCTGLYPMTHWIMIGLHENGTVTSEDNNFTRSFETTERMREATVEEIKETLKEYKLSGLVNHLGDKLRVTWTDGSFDYSLRMHQNNKYSSLSQYLSEQKKDFFILYSQAFYVAMLFFVIINVYYQLRSGYNGYLFMLSLALFGAVVFYLIWEGKGSYSLPFLPIIYMLAIPGAGIFGRKIETPAFYAGLEKVMTVIVVLSIGTMISVYSIYTTEEITRYDRSVESMNGSCVRYIENSAEIKQEFYTDIPFNTLEIKGKEIEGEEGRYLITLKDDKNTYLSTIVDEKSINNSGNIVLEFDKISPSDNQKYEIIIRNLSSVDAIYWGYTLTEAMDNYKGNCIVDGLGETYDLYIQVYNKYETTYSKPLRYVFACGIILLLEIFSLYYINKMKQISKKQNI